MIDLKKLAAIFTLGVLYFAVKGAEDDIVVEVKPPTKEEPVIHPESARCANAAAYAAISALAKSAKDATYESQMLKAATDIYNIAKKHPELAAFAITKLSKISQDCNYTSTSRSIDDMITKLV